MAKSHLSWRVSNVKNDEADIDIFDVIGDPWDGTTAQDFVKELRAIKASRINLHINSPGGFVNDALAMYNALRQHSAQIVAYIESEAASAASFVALAADKVAIFGNAKMFIHDGHALVRGNAADMRHIADLLDEESDNIASIYAEKAGGTRQEWRERMQANDGVGTSYRGQEAVDIGLADEVVSTARNYDPERIAALAKGIDTDALANGTEPMEVDLSAIKEAAKRERVEPTLESLLQKHTLKEAVQSGVGGN